MQPVDDLDSITARIRQIDSGGGGIFTWTALRHAAFQLTKAPQLNKHIVLFADAADAEEPGAEHAVTLGPVGHDEAGRPGRVHEVVPGDTLWDISDAYLGTPWVWPSIWQDNQDIENPHLIYPGDLIWITPWEMRKAVSYTHLRAHET